MNKIIISLTLLAVIVFGAYFFAISNQQTAPDIPETPETTQLKVVSTEIKEVVEDSDEAGVYATLSNGETKFIAVSSDLDTLENYFDVITYREAFISPDKSFVAVQGSQFEDAIVQVYEVETDMLYEIIYGIVLEWTSDGLLKIESCNLAGENCVDKISVSAETPWIVGAI